MDYIKRQYVSRKANVSWSPEAACDISPRNESRFVENMKTRSLITAFAVLAMPVAAAGCPLLAQSAAADTTKQPASQTPKRISAGTGMVAARLVHKVPPQYPTVAKLRGIQGTVRLEALIGTDGKMKHLRVLAGDPMLVKPSLDAVKKWRYKPVLINGQHVEVESEIDVIFSLQR